ncbi:MAG: DNA-3-methyladenine glycosylase family protein [Hyphomicrobium sp.]
MTRLRTSSIGSADALAAAAESLARRCDVMAALYRANGPPPIRDIRPDFSGLTQIICGQQVSAASAASIWRRVATGLSPLNAAAVRATTDANLAALGLSRPKIRTLKMLAEAVESGALDIRALNRSSDEAVFAQLTALHGIGPWTADIYLLFALKRPDAFPAGDLALQLAAGRLLADQQRLAAPVLLEIAERWRPLRAIAARMLWDDYGRQRTTKTGTPAAPRIAKAPARRNTRN